MVILYMTVLFPIIAGILIAAVRPPEGSVRILVSAALAAEAVFAVVLCFSGEVSATLFSMTEVLRVELKTDAAARLFLLISVFGYLLAGIFAGKYFDHDKSGATLSKNTFYCFYLTSLGALAGMAVSANLIAMYFFFELATLLSMPMVLYERTKESVAAALKYLFYSIAGAFLGLACIFVLSRFCDTLSFIPGGTLNTGAVSGREGLVLAMTFLGIVGFGAKAGLYPLHSWLAAAHPVAPAPASAVLSGVITKAGVLAILRLIFYTVGADFLSGTWVQTVLVILSLITVFMGSMMAYMEPLIKKRLAYSSVSQISYVLFGLFTLTPDGYTGALMQVLFHAAAKIGLFLFAGSIIYNTGIYRADKLRGYGKAMPKTFTAFSLLSLSLTGIPPFSGFVSKWYIAMGALSAELPVFSWLGPVILIISALLTAGYLFPVSVSGFFPGKSFKFPAKNDEGGARMLIPLLLLALLTLVLGICGMTGIISGMSAGLF